MLRQGDILLVPVKSLPKGVVKRKDNVLAYGETTGHKHQLVSNVQTYALDDEVYFEAFKDTELVHEEHNTLKVDRGVYKVIRQREYSPSENRRVLD